MTTDRLPDAAWRAYRAELLGFARKRVGNDSAAEDIVQDVLVRAYERRDTLRDPARLRAWLFRIARNAITDHYRAHRPEDPLPPDLAAEPAEADRSAEQELAACLRPLIDDLPEPDRMALVLADLEGVKQQEIAGRLGLSVSGAKSRVQRARARLRDRILACCRVEVDRRGGVTDYKPRRACRDCED